VNKQFGTIIFNENPNINSEIVIKLIQKEYHTYKLAGKNTLKFKMNSEKPDSRIGVVEELLEKLAK